MDRRVFLGQVSAMAAGGLIAGCSSGVQATNAPKVAPVQIIRNDAAFNSFLNRLANRALAKGYSQATVRAGFQGAGYLPSVVKEARNPIEKRRSFEDYLAIATSDERIAKGRSAVSRFQGVFSELERRYGLPSEILGAIWGMESWYGARRGSFPVVSSLASLVYANHRADFFETQLFAALEIIERGHTTSDKMTGSWAGAMGHTQFIPTTFLGYAVDGTGDGRADIWGDDPTDALASSASYLARVGWTRGRHWGRQVRLPSGFSTTLTGRSNARSASAWSSLGVRDMAGRPLADGGSLAIVWPAAPNGPAFAVTSNFWVILRYNNSVNYGLGIAALGDRLAGRPAIVTGFGQDQWGLTLEDRKDLQRLLARRGYDVGTIDGVVGGKTLAAIAAYQKANGLPVTAQPSQALLEHLRRR